MAQDNSPKKFQIQRRLTKMVAPCDKLSSHPFDYPADEYATIINDHEECGCIEGVDKKNNEVCTPYWLSLVGDYLDTKPLTPFHREVLFSSISAYEQGYRVLTYSITLNTLTGGQNEFHIKQFEALKTAFEKLMYTGITVDLAPLLNAYPNYRKRHVGKAILQGLLLPAKIIDAEINGQRTLAIELLGESPLMTIAKLKKQLITYELAPLAVPNQRQTEKIITLNNYLLRRIHLVKRGVNPSIMLETVYKNCGLENATRWQKQDARKVIDETLNHFKSEGVIKNFTWVKENGSYRSITIELKTAPAKQRKINRKK